MMVMNDVVTEMTGTLRGVETMKEIDSTIEESIRGRQEMIGIIKESNNVTTRRNKAEIIRIYGSECAGHLLTRSGRCSYKYAKYMLTSKNDLFSAALVF